MLTHKTHELLQRLEQIKPFFTKIRSISISDYVRVAATNISYYNLDAICIAPLNGNGQGIFMIPFALLREYLQKTTHDEIIFDEMAGHPTFGSIHTKFILEKHFSPDNFPIVPIYDFNVSGSATPDQLRHAFSCYYATDKDDSRNNLRGVYLDPENKCAVASNGHRLSLRTLEFPLHTTNKYVIPRSVAKTLATSIHNTVAFSTSDSSNEWLMLSTDGMTIYVKCEDSYPDYQRVIPKEGSLKLYFEEPRLTLKRLRDIKKTFPKLQAIALRGYRGELQVANESYKTTWQYDCEAYEDCLLLININYLMDCFKQYTQPINVYNLDEKTGPWVFKIDDSRDLDIIMPIKYTDEESWFTNNQT